MKAYLKLCILTFLFNIICSIKISSNNSKDNESEIIFLQIHKKVKNKVKSKQPDDEAKTESQSAQSEKKSNEQKDILNTNVVGKPKSKVWIEEAPYKVENCDQVIMFEAEKIKDLENYFDRSPAFFTMNAYVINMFESKDVTKLTESINLSHIKILPQILEGSKNCLMFQDNFTSRHITICFKNNDSVVEIQNVYDNFMKCRMGLDLKQPDPKVINNILEASCEGFTNSKGVNFDLVKIKQTVSDELKKSGFDVTEETAHGKGELIIENTSEIKKESKIQPTRPRPIKVRVPGTPIPVDPLNDKSVNSENLPDIY